MGRLITSLRTPWLCMGDFNEMISQEEKEGTRPVDIRRMELFRNFLNVTKLMDTDLKGCNFTWVSNPRDGVITKEKLDRVLITGG